MAAASISSHSESCLVTSASMLAEERFQRSAEATVPKTTRGERCTTDAGQPSSGGQGSWPSRHRIGHAPRGVHQLGVAVEPLDAPLLAVLEEIHAVVFERALGVSR